MEPSNHRPSSRLPRWTRAVLGVACVTVGASLATRPFTSLSVLVLLVATAAIVTGATRWAGARRTAGRLDDLTAAGWVVLGIAVAAWPDLSVRGIAVAVGIGMIVGGVAELVGGLRGTTDERVAAVLSGAASAVFGALALAWPDVTLLVVAVVFGVRTVLFGLSELLGAVRGDRPDRAVSAGRPGTVRRSLHVVRALGALAVAVLLGGVSAVLHAGEPTLDAFYRTPADLPAEPGRLLRVDDFTTGIPDGAVAWRILYTTTRLDDTPVVASALVVVPAGAAAEPHPVIAWAHGTTGVDRTCAPSALDDPLGSGAFYNLDEVLDQGWALVATDYVGLGTEGTHPYLIGEPEAHSVLDAVRAAKALDEIELADQTVVWGHSQGGGAALWTGQVAPDYAPDVNVLGVAALAPVSDPTAFATTLAQVPGGSIFASYALTGYSSTYPDVRFDDYVTPAARSTVRDLAGRCLGEPEFLVSLLTSISTSMSVFDADLTGGPLGARLVENVPAGPYEVPLLVAQGATDPLILPDSQVDFVTGLCDAGNDVDYRVYPGRDHVGLVSPDSPLVPELVEWTQQRLAGSPFVGTCPG